MDSGPGWLPDPEDEQQERYWSGSVWTGRVRPAGTGRSFHLPEHVPELQRALAAATADIDVVEARLSNLFDRTEGRVPPPEGTAAKLDPTNSQAADGAGATAPDADDSDEPIEFEEEPIDLEDEDAAEPIQPELEGPSGPDEDGDVAAFAELDAALAAEEPDDEGLEGENSENAEQAPPRRGFLRRRS